MMPFGSGSPAYALTSSPASPWRAENTPQCEVCGLKPSDRSRPGSGKPIVSSIVAFLVPVAAPSRPHRCHPGSSIAIRSSMSSGQGLRKCRALVQRLLGQRSQGRPAAIFRPICTFIFNALVGCIQRPRGPSFGKTWHEISCNDTDIEMCDMPPVTHNIGPIMIKRVLPYEGLLHEVVAHHGV